MLPQPNLGPVPRLNQYQLKRDYEITVEGFDIVIPRGFEYDGASIPSAAWQVTYSPFHPDVMLPALVHDWLFYTHITGDDGQEAADDIFYKLLRQNEVSYLKANAMWAAVRTAGHLFWDNDEEDMEKMVALCKKVKDRPNFKRYKFPKKIRKAAGL